MPESELRLAASPTSWGVDFADDPENPRWDFVLDQIAQSGVRALELGPVGYLPEDAPQLRAALRNRGLTAVGSFLFEDLHDPDKRTEILAIALRACRMIAAADGKILVIIDRPGHERAATAGRGDVARRLAAATWQHMVDLIGEIAAIAHGHGLTAAVHPHAGSYIEFDDEIAAVARDSDVGLCLDTGHLIYAGIQPVTALRAYASRLVHVHLKDIAPTVLAMVSHRNLGFWDAIAAGVFCPIGKGSLELSATHAAIMQIGYRGFVTLEQDRVAGSGAPLADLERSLSVIGHWSAVPSPPSDFGPQ